MYNRREMEVEPEGRPGTAAQYAYRVIRSRIVDGTLPPGSRASYKDLQHELGISLIPIREAIQQLAAEGFIRAEPHRGATVADLSPDELNELYLVRSLLEVPAAVLAVQRLTPEVLDRMRELHAEIQVVDSVGDIRGYHQLNNAFHRTLYEATGLRQYQRLITSLQDATSAYRHIFFSDERHRRAAIEDHARLIAALEYRDVDAVRVITAEHLQLTWSIAPELQRRVGAGREHGSRAPLINGGAGLSALQELWASSGTPPFPRPDTQARVAPPEACGGQDPVDAVQPSGSSPPARSQSRPVKRFRRSTRKSG